VLAHSSPEESDITEKRLAGVLAAGSCLLLGCTTKKQAAALNLAQSLSHL
jgi:uncharacterized SAM-dependent methyltransferase